MPILDALRTLIEFLVKLTKTEWSRALVICIIIAAIWRMTLVEAENKELRIENRNFDTQCNAIVRNITDSMGKREDSLVAIIVAKDMEAQVKENKLLQEQLEEVKKLQKNVKNVSKTNDRIINQQRN